MRTKTERRVESDVVRRRKGAARWPDNTRKDPKDWITGDDPMTGAQESYLKTLAEQAHENPPGTELTKAEASELIDKMRQKAGLDE